MGSNGLSIPYLPLSSSHSTTLLQYTLAALYGSRAIICWSTLFSSLASSVSISVLFSLSSTAEDIAIPVALSGFFSNSLISTDTCSPNTILTFPLFPHPSSLKSNSATESIISVSIFSTDAIL